MSRSDVSKKKLQLYWKAPKNYRKLPNNYIKPLLALFNGKILFLYIKYGEALTSWINLRFPPIINFAVTRCSDNTWNCGYKQLRSVPCCGLRNNKYCLRSIFPNSNNQVQFICVNKYKVGCGVKFWQLIFTTIKTSQTCFVTWPSSWSCW